MPCLDPGPSYNDIERAQRERDIITRLACDRCREIEARGGVVPAWALEWWQQHKQADALRQRTERKARQDMATRQRAIAKLTPEERAELGV
jgi:hypothetical protein